MRIVLLASALLALVLGGAALAAGPRAQAHATDGTLSGSVGPGFTISMSTARVAPGAYEITISDTSDLHNFHLVGPGVDLATSIEGTGKTTWNVTLQAGTYRFRCDAHAAQMTGQLVVGS
ncbi:MAG TPA: hypothetical protein VFJ77_01905, partial [Gaiellaceae bacterium]|nr:hypothetical protein [Gaiellaceae bacterium]